MISFINISNFNKIKSSFSMYVTLVNLEKDLLRTLI